MEIAKQINHIEAMSSYLENLEVGQNRAAIEDELTEMVQKGDPNPEIASRLLSLGYARPLRVYVDRHGFFGLENGTVDVFDMLNANYGAHEALECVKIIQAASRLDACRRMVKMIKIFIYGYTDAPDEMIKAMQVQGLGPMAVTRALSEGIAWGPTLPKTSLWFAGFLQEHFDPKDTDWRILLDRAIFAPHPHLLGALLKMGINIIPDLLSTQVSNGEFAFIPRIIARANSSHARMALMSSLPEVAELLVMQPQDVVLLIAGPK